MTKKDRAYCYMAPDEFRRLERACKYGLANTKNTSKTQFLKESLFACVAAVEARHNLPPIDEIESPDVGAQILERLDEIEERVEALEGVDSKPPERYIIG